ncbi:MAG: hypothetical protein GC191_16745 [Azospirillum sp.]|nr:hypothetical protein [Azospirillum sp.]
MADTEAEDRIPAGGTGEVDERIFAATFDLAARWGWRGFGMALVASESGVTLAELHRRYAGRRAILEGFIERIDRAVLAETGVGEDPDETARDRLFDVLMRRFDALRPYRGGLAALYGERRQSAAALVAVGPRLARSMAWMLIAAGIEPQGPRGLAAVAALSAIYLATLKVWLKDESPDLARTMAALDSRLRWAEQLVHRCRRRRPQPRPVVSAAV